MAFRAPEVVVPYQALSDSDLAGRFDRGEGEALNALCRRHYSIVFRFAYRLTQNLPEAEDCTQEAFARFCREAEIMSQLRHPNIVQLFDFNIAPEEIDLARPRDNRNNSEDSRAFGSLLRGLIVGQALLVYWPPNRIRLLFNR